MMEGVKRQWIWPVLAAGLILYLCAFKVGNTDFWWHIAAGRIIRTGQWILTDPFAYTRIGEPYLANQSWLSQIALSSAYDRLGIAGITVLRTLIVLITFAFPVMLYKKHLWIGSALAVLAAVASRPALTDRPQLFTFLFFSIFMVLCLRYLDASDPKRKRILLLLPLVILLWTNFHGAASFVGMCMYGALVVHRFFSLWYEKNLRSWEIKWLVLFGLIMIAATILAPKGIGNISYLLDLTKDSSADFIQEWQSASLVHFLKVTGFFWAASIAAMLYSRSHLVFCILLLGGIGYLGKSAPRHEILFVISAISVTLFQLRQRNLVIKKFTLALPVAVFIAITLVTYVRSYDINRTDHLFGYGVFAPGKGASNFLKQSDTNGNMFNNYNIGGELLFYGHKVFLDGRNLDYGYDYINRAVNAGVDQSVWDALEEEYAFTHAVIYYDLQAELDPIPYISLLDNDSNWSLVYLDDWAAVYVKKGIEGIKEVKEITSITPKMLHDQKIPSQMSLAEFRNLESELRAIIQARPDGVKGRLYLAKLYTSLEGYDQAEALLLEALELEPHNYLIYIGLTKLSMEQERWDEAWAYLKKAKRTAGFSGVQINEEFVEQVRKNAKNS